MYHALVLLFRDERLNVIAESTEMDLEQRKQFNCHNFFALHVFCFLYIHNLYILMLFFYSLQDMSMDEKHNVFSNPLNSV